MRRSMARLFVGPALLLLLVGAAAAAPGSNPTGPQPIVSAAHPVSADQRGHESRRARRRVRRHELPRRLERLPVGRLGHSRRVRLERGKRPAARRGDHCRGPGSQEYSAVDWDGQNFLVTWVGDGSLGGLRVYGARVSPAGQVLGQFTISGSVTLFANPAVAFNGTNFLVAWSQGDDIVANRVTPGGSVLDGTGFTVGDSAEFERSPDVGTDGTGSSSPGNSATAARTSCPWPHGSAVAGQCSIRTGSHSTSAPATRGCRASRSTARATSSPGANMIGGDVAGSRVTPAGTVLDPNGFPIAAGPTRESNPTVSWDGSVFETLWTDAPTLQ